MNDFERIARLKLPALLRGWALDVALARETMGRDPSTDDMVLHTDESYRTCRNRLLALVKAGVLTGTRKKRMDGQRVWHYTLRLPGEWS